MKNVVLPILSLLMVFSSSAQNIIQDNKGQTSLNLNPGNNKSEKDATKIETVDFGLGQVKLSTAENKLEVNYYQYFKRKHAASFVGASAAGEVKNSITSLFSSGDVAPGAEFKIRAGVRLWKRKISDYGEWETAFEKKKGRKPHSSEIQVFVAELSTAADLWLVGNAGFAGSKFKLFYPDSVYSKQLEKINFSSPQINVGFNYWNANILKCVTLFGLTLGAKKTNNFDDLAESVSEEVTVRTNPSDSSTRKVTEKNTVYKGAYKEITTYPFNFDIFFKPHKFQNVAFLLYIRNEMFKVEKPQTKIGGGFYFLRKNNLFDPVFGINIDYKDVFDNNSDDDSNSKWSKLKIGIVTDLQTLLFQNK